MVIGVDDDDNDDFEVGIVSKVVTLHLTQGTRSKVHPKKTYVDLLEDDAGYAVN